MSKLPSVTISMISYNDENIIEDCLKSIFVQNYPRDKFEVLIIDGGSSDRTVEISKSYGAKVISLPELKNKPDIRGVISANLPKTDLIVSFSADNRFLEEDCLIKMVEPFSDSEIVASETFHYGFRKSDPILSRYFALIGGADPVAIALGKADRAPWDKESWHSFGKVEDSGEYYKVEFENNISKIPTIGANGFIFRRDALKKIGMIDHGGHTDFCVRFIRSGYNKFAFIKNRKIIHFIDISLFSFMKRRLLHASRYLPERIKREYQIFTNKDWLRLIWIIFTFPTFIFPLFRAIKGYNKKQDVAWFIHPIACFFFFMGYSSFFITRAISRLKKRFGNFGNFLLRN